MPDSPIDYFVYYTREREAVSSLEQYINCDDLNTEFDILIANYIDSKKNEDLQKLQNVINSYYKRALPKIFLQYFNIIEKREGKHQSYHDEKKNLKKLQRKFEENHLRIGEYKLIFDELQEIIDEIRIKQKLEKNITKNRIRDIIITFILGIATTLIGIYIL